MKAVPVVLIQLEFVAKSRNRFPSLQNKLLTDEKWASGLLLNFSFYVELLQRFLVKKLGKKTKETYRFNVV